MADRDITVRVKADIAAYKRAMEDAAQAAKKAAGETGKAGDSARKAGDGFDAAGKKAKTAGDNEELAGRKARQAGEEAERAGKQSESGMQRLAQTAQKHKKTWDMVSNAMIAGGTAIAGGLALATKEAISWESAFAGVRKTTDGTEAQYKQLEDGLRGLAKTLPSTHTEIAGVAEAAGQLGVAREDIVGFTKTMIDLGESTNLTAEDAATNIAQISNVMGTMNREGTEGISRFGAALVALGNDGASTEAEILAMSQRIAGAGATIGASESDVLALSNTLASMGVKAELGGGVTTRVLLKMRTAVDEGGESLEAFAQVAGLSAEQFSKKFKTAPVEALDLVAKGIHGVNEAGGNVTETLSDLGVKGTEEVQVMLALANSGDLLTDSLKLGAQAWEENTALVAEAEQRYGTTEAKIKIAWNNIKDAAIDAGGVIMPVVGDIAEAISDLVGWFSDLPGPVKTALTVLGSIAGAGALTAGGFMKIMNWLPGTIDGLKALGVDAPKADRAVRGVGKALGGITAVGAGLVIGKQVIEGINDAVRSGKPDVEDYFNILATGGGVDLADSLNFDPGNDFTGLKQLENVRTEADVTARAIERLSTMNDALLGRWWSENITLGDTRKEIDQALELEKAMQGLARAFEMGEADRGQQVFSDFADRMKLTDDQVGELINNIPELKSALTQLATDNGIQIDPNDNLGLVDLALGRIKTSAPEAAGAVGEVKTSVEETGVSAEEAAKQIDDFYQALVNAGMVVLSEREAMRGLEESFDAAREAVEKNGKTLDITTEKGRANQQALDNIADASFRAMEAQRENGASTADLADTLEQGREAFINNAVAMGMNEEAAGKLADKIGLIPGSVYISFDSNTDSLASKLEEIHQLVQGTPNGKVTISENSPEVIKGLETLGYIVTKLPNGKIEVSETGTDASGKKIDETAGKKRTAKIDAEAFTDAAETALNYAARSRSSYITQTVTTNYKVTGTKEVEGKAYGQYAKYQGGRLPGFDSGGRLPYTGLGRDMILGVTTDGRPIANVDDGEWVIREKSASKFDRVLGLINRDDPSVQGLAGLAGGGRVGWSRGQTDMLRGQAKDATAERRDAERELKSLERAYDKIDSDKKHKTAKAAAKRRVDTARKALDRAKKAEDAAKDAVKDSRDRTGRLVDDVFDLRRDVKRGSIVDQFTSGSGMSVVDRMFDQSKNKDLSKSARSSLQSTAYSMERQLLGLEKQSESLEKKLDKATEARDRLLRVSESVSSGLRGEYSLGGVLDKLRTVENSGPLSAGAFIKSARSKAQQIKKFGELLGKLRKKGYNEAIIQEIADLGTADGLQVGQALLNASSAERTALNQAYKSMDYWSNKAGVEVTKSMYKGGIDSANGLVRGLESKQHSVENAFYQLGKRAERSFKQSLGIHSPSKVMQESGGYAGDGAVLGGLSKIPDIQKAYGSMGEAASEAYRATLGLDAPALTVPPSVEVSRYAQAQRGFDAGAIASAVASAIASYQPVVNIGGREFHGIMKTVNESYGTRK